MKIKFGNKNYSLNSTLSTKVEMTWRSPKKGFHRLHFNLENLSEAESILLKAHLSKREPTAFKRELVFQKEFLRNTDIVVDPEMFSNEVKSEFRLNAKVLKFVSTAEREQAALAINNRRSFKFNKQNVFFQVGTKRPKVKFGGIPPNNCVPFGSLLLWVFDPGTHMWAFYHLDKKLYLELRQIERNAIAIEKISDDLFEVLMHSRVLVTRKHLTERRAIWKKHKRKSRTVAREGFGVLRQVLPPLQKAFLKMYTQDLFSNGYFHLDHLQVKDRTRYLCNKNEICEYLHRQSGELVRHVTGETIIPSWNIFAKYLAGAELKRHRDTDQSAWNVSLLVDSRVPSKEWPLHVLDSNSKHQTGDLEIGDLAIYRGMDLTHWRLKLQGNSHTMILWFYVSIHFLGLQGDPQFQKKKI